MKILITGCCGFIGFNFANFLAKSNKKIRIIGIDNLNDYYSVNLKRKRLKELNKNKNFTFYKIDINQYEKLKKRYQGGLKCLIWHGWSASKENKAKLLRNQIRWAGNHSLSVLIYKVGLNIVSTKRDKIFYELKDFLMNLPEEEWFH